MNADYIMKSTAVFDAVCDKPFSGFVAVNGNRITYVGRGTADLVKYAGQKTKIVECGDRLIMPGIIDAHMHFFDGIFQNSKFMCRDLFACKSAAECVSAISRFAESHPEYERIVGMGWFIPLWDDKTPPDKHMLDAVESHKPMYLMCADGHSFWLNSKAMEECDIDPDRDLLFGEFEKDEHGEANGVMHELDACAAPAIYSQQIPADDRLELIKNFASNLAEFGITGTTDMAILPEPIPITDDVKAVAALDKNGEFNLRLNLYPSLGSDESFAIAKEYRKKFNSDKLRIAGLKAFVDGVHGSHTALLLDPYLDLPGYKGESFYPHEHYVHLVEAANKNGFGIKLHCCGEGAVHWALDAYEHSHLADADTNVRNSIEHVETFRPKDLERFSKYNITAAMQPLHLMYEGNILYTILGPERAKYEYAVNTLLDCGINVAFSSDYPVADFNPMKNIYFATTRCDVNGSPIENDISEAVTMAQALKAYTAGSAYCLNMDDRLGTLESGKLADITVLEKNLFTSSPVEILNTRADLTMVDGVISYNRLF